MKIKCPLGGKFRCDDEYVDSAQLFQHLWRDHNENEYGKYLADKIFKIHEKIESLQSEIKDNHFEDCDSGHDFETHQNIEFAIEELKSLLENDKK